MSLRSEIQQLIVDCLRLGLQQLIVDRLEEVLRPLREETSTIKLWLARLANHLEFVEPHGEHTSFSNMSELFGPCSPVHRSPTPSILTSLVLAYMPSDSLGPEETCVHTTNPVANELEFRTVLNPDSNEVVDAEIHQKMPMEQAIEGPFMMLSTLASLVEVCTPADSLVCEDTCAISADSINGEMTIEKVVAMPSMGSLL